MKHTKLILGLAFATLSGSALAVRITPAHSGSWYDPDYDKQGFVIEVLGKAGNGPERVTAVNWYTYDDDGNPVWAVGTGVTNGNLLTVNLQQAFGGARPPEQVEASDLVDFAEVQFTFGTCNNATADFEMSDGGAVGTYHLVRLTQIGATTCTGGMSDEVEPGAEPVTLVAQMSAGAGFSGAQGMVQFKLRPAYSSLEIDLKKLPAGDYTVRIGGEDRGSVSMVANGNGNGITMGTLKLASPADGADGLLDFDPRGQLIEIVDAIGAVALSTTLGG